KLHNKETLPSWKPLYAKEFLFPCVPERVIMLTNFEYAIQTKRNSNFREFLRIYFQDIDYRLIIHLV
ncbi:hypothetical protein CN367_03205, partial [Priestia megaterium]